MKRAIRFCLPMILFSIFLLAGLIGLFFEHMHNDLLFSTGAFLTSFATLSGIAYKIYDLFFL